MLMNDKQDQFWNLVVECLHDFFGAQRTAAKNDIVVYRQTLEAESKRLRANNVVYHETPAQVACDIAGKQLTPEYARKFEQLLAGSGGEVITLKARGSSAKRTVSKIKGTLAGASRNKPTAEPKKVAEKMSRRGKKRIGQSK
jgi:hypothetical protein